MTFQTPFDEFQTVVRRPVLSRAALGPQWAKQPPVSRGRALAYHLLASLVALVVTLAMAIVAQALPPAPAPTKLGVVAHVAPRVAEACCHFVANLAQQAQLFI